MAVVAVLSYSACVFCVWFVDRCVGGEYVAESGVGRGGVERGGDGGGGDGGDGGDGG